MDIGEKERKHHGAIGGGGGVLVGVQTNNIIKHQQELHKSDYNHLQRQVSSCGRGNRRYRT